MTGIDDRPTMGERYIAAVESSNLKLGERRGAVDTVIAAGLVPGLGPRLWRLIEEYVRLDKTLKVSQPSADGKTHRAFIYLNLPGLYEIKFQLLDIALELARRRRYDIDDDDIRKIVGRCIESFLDDICGHCNGAGVIGQYGGPQPICRPCQGEGRRSVNIGQGPLEASFAKALLAAMDGIMSTAEVDMKSNRRAVDEAKKWIEEQGKR